MEARQTFLSSLSFPPLAAQPFLPSHELQKKSALSAPVTVSLPLSPSIACSLTSIIAAALVDLLIIPWWGVEGELRAR